MNVNPKYLVSLLMKILKWDCYGLFFFNCSVIAKLALNLDDFSPHVLKCD